VSMVSVPAFVATQLVEEIAAIVADMVVQRLETSKGPEWMRVDQAAEHLQMTPDAIRALVKRDKVPHHRTPSGRVLLERNELDRWVRGEQ
jgi:excisionase family DNA binding protein